RFSDPQAIYVAILMPLKFRAAEAEGKQPVILVLETGEEIATWERLLVYHAGRIGCCTRTLRRWVTRYERHGYAGLVSRPRRDRGHSKTFYMRLLAADFVIGCFLTGWTPAA